MPRIRALLLLPIVLSGAPRLAAQQRSVDEMVVEPAPWVTLGDLRILGVGAGLAFIAQRADLSVRNELQGVRAQRDNFLNTMEPVGDHWGGGLALVSSVGMWGGGLIARNETVATVGLRAYESIIVAGVITKTLKAAFGRARPRVDSLDAWNVQWNRRGGNDYESFPSGHTSAAFAFAAAVTSEVARRAPDRQGLVGTASFALAGVTAWSRMHADAHWLSDVTMGAAIGMASGWAVTRWHATRPDNAFDRALLPRRRLAPFVTSAPHDRTLVGVSVAWR